MKKNVSKVWFKIFQTLQNKPPNKLREHISLTCMRSIKEEKIREV